MRRRSGPSGFTLATTLMVAAIALLASFSLVGSSVVQLAVDYRLNNRQIAHNLAETSIADAVRRILDDGDYGASGEALSDTLPDTPPTRSGS